MTIELRYLAGAVVLGLVHVLLLALLTVIQLGMVYGLSPRDEGRRLTGVPGRVERAFGNFMQTFPFFAAAVLAGQALGRHGWMTEWGAALYFWARLVYVPMYAFAVTGLRSLVFIISFAGIVFVLMGLA
jgi:uncharacterized MAPEG superfamily protein